MLNKDDLDFFVLNSLNAKVDIEQDIPKEESQTNMDLGVCAEMIKSQMPELSTEAANMAAILATIADASMGGGFVLDTENNRTVKESYEQYEMFKVLRGDYL